MSGTLGYIFYTRVTDSQRLHKGGGKAEEGELIEVVEVPVSQALQEVFDDTLQKPVGLTYSLLWFYYTHHDKLSSTVLNGSEKGIKEAGGGGRIVDVFGGKKNDVEVVSVQNFEASSELSIYRLHYKQVINMFISFTFYKTLCVKQLLSVLTTKVY